ncbi:MAG: YHS domain-containing protein [Acidobacteria bacterium]|nr:YHS domain-containing protein [Acidobacteriota bacterium]
MILRTILRNLLSPRPGANRQSREIQGVMMKDPVCGMYVDVRAAPTARKKGKDFYFCSEECRTRFIAADG